MVTNWLEGIFHIDNTPESPIDHVAKVAKYCEPLRPHDIVSELAQSLCIVLEEEHESYDFVYGGGIFPPSILLSFTVNY